MLPAIVQLQVTSSKREYSHFWWLPAQFGINVHIKTHHDKILGTMCFLSEADGHAHCTIVHVAGDMTNQTL